MKTNILKVNLCILFIMVSLTIWTQKNYFVQGSITINYSSIMSYEPNNYKVFDYSQYFKNIDFSKQEYIFSSFNRTSSLYDNYFIDDTTFTFSNSNMMYKPKSNILTDLFIENSNNIQYHSFGINNVGMPVRDSFNPYGTTSIKTAIKGGILGLLFN